MNNPTSRLRGTTKTSAPHTSPPTPSLAGPGQATLLTTLGDDGYIALRRHRQATHTALGTLAQLLCDTAREADRLHTTLRRYATSARDHLNDALTDQGPPHADATVILYSSRSTELHAARYAQQMNQLDLVLDAYQNALLAV
jgi:hypothetical protein